MAPMSTMCVESNKGRISATNNARENWCFHLQGIELVSELRLVVPVSHLRQIDSC